jgi:hypothetical protein
MRICLIFLMHFLCIHVFAQKFTSYYDSNKRLYGYKDGNDKIVIEPSYAFAMDFSEGLGMIKTSEKKYGFINSSNKIVIPAIYRSARSFSEGFSVVSDSLNSFFIDKTGKKKFLQNFTDASSFQNGVAGVMNKDSLWGYIGPTGSAMIPYQYKKAGEFSEGLAFVKKEGKWLAIDQKNAIKFEVDAIRVWAYKNGFAAIQLKDKGGDNYGDEWNFLNKKGQLLSNDKFEFIEKFEGKTAIVNIYDNRSNSRKYGAIDTTGKIVLPLEYAYLKRYSNCFLYSQSSGLTQQWFGLIDSHYKVATKDKYKFVINYGDTLFVVQVQDKSFTKSNLLNLAGTELIPISYQSVEVYGTSANPVLLFYTNYGSSIPGRTYNVKHGMIGQLLCVPDEKYNIFVNTNGLEKYPIMDLDGKPLLDNTFKVLYHASYRNIGADMDKYEKIKRKYPAASTIDSTWFFDKKAKKLIAMKYFVAEDDDFSDGLLKVTDNFKASKYSTNDKTKYGFLDSTFKLVIPLIYSGVNNFREGKAKFEKMEKDGYTKKVGFIDKSGKEVIKPVYTDATDFKNGYCLVNGGGKTLSSISILDKTGKPKIIIENVRFNSIADVSEDGLVFFENESGKWGMWNIDGKNLIPAEYSIDKKDYYPRFGNTGKVPLLKDGKTYFFDKTGKLYS